MSAPETDGRRTGSRGLTIAFRGVAGFLGIALLLLTVPFSLFPLLDEAETIHRVHNAVGGLGYSLLLGGSLLALAIRQGLRSAFLAVVAFAIAGAIGGTLSGDFVTGSWFIPIVAALVLFALHPNRRSLFRVDAVDLPSAGLAILAAVPAVSFALTQAAFQRDCAPGADPHCEFHHYSSMGVLALSIVAIGLAAAGRAPGRRVEAWLLGVTAIVLGAASLAEPSLPGAVDTLWAWLAIAFGVLYVANAEIGTRRMARTA